MSTKLRPPARVVGPSIHAEHTGDFFSPADSTDFLYRQVCLATRDRGSAAWYGFDMVGFVFRLHAVAPRHETSLRHEMAEITATRARLGRGPVHLGITGAAATATGMLLRLWGEVRETLAGPIRRHLHTASEHLLWDAVGFAMDPYRKHAACATEDEIYFCAGVDLARDVIQNVRKYLPADFNGCTASDEFFLEDMPLMVDGDGRDRAAEFVSERLVRTAGSSLFGVPNENACRRIYGTARPLDTSYIRAWRIAHWTFGLVSDVVADFPDWVDALTKEPPRLVIDEADLQELRAELELELAPAAKPQEAAGSDPGLELTLAATLAVVQVGAPGLKDDIDFARDESLTVEKRLTELFKRNRKYIGWTRKALGDFLLVTPQAISNAISRSDTLRSFLGKHCAKDE